MKYCTKCGAKLTEGAKFCIVCGTSVEASVPVENYQLSSNEQSSSQDVIGSTETPAVPAKKKFKLGILIAILAVLAVLAVAAVFLFPRLFFSAPDKFVEMHRAIISPVVDYTAQAVTMDQNKDLSKKVKDYSGIDTDFTVTLDMDTGSSTADEILDGSSVTFKVKQTESDKSLFGFAVNLSGSDILSGTVVTEKDRLCIYLPELSDDYYQIYFDDIGDILSALGIDADVDVKDMMEAASGKDSPLGVDSDQLKAVIDSYLDIFFSMVNKDNTTSSKEEIYLPGCEEKVRCTVITFKPTADDITKMVKKLCDKLEDDDQIREMVKNIAAYAYMVDSSMAYRFKNEDEYVDYILKSYDEAVEDLWDKYEDKIADFAEDIEDKNVSWKIAYKGLRVHLISITDDEYNGIGYESVGNVLELRTDMLVEYDDGDAKKIAENTVKIAGKKAEGSARVYKLDDGTAKVDYSVDWTQKSGLNIPYGEIKFRYGDYNVNMNVESEGTGSQHDITVRMDDNKIKIGIFSTDKESTVTEPKKTPVKVDSDNIMDVIQGMYGKIMEIVGNIYG